MSATAYSTRRFSFAAGHKYWVESWPAAENERVFGRLNANAVGNVVFGKNLG